MVFFMLFGHSEPLSGREACLKSAKKVSSSIFPKSYFSATMGEGGEKLPLGISQWSDFGAVFGL